MRDKLVEQLTELSKQANIIRKEIEKFDYDNKFSEANKYLGKYYKEVYNNNDKYISCVYVYGIKDDNCELKSMTVSYWSDSERYYNIGYKAYFHPKEDEEDGEKWIEIDKEEFMIHHDNVQKMISKFLNNLR